MLTTSREFVLNDKRQETNTRLSRTNDLFKEETKVENTFGFNSAPIEKNEVSRIREFGLFGGKNETVVDPRPSQETLTQLTVAAPIEKQQESSIQMTMFEDSKASVQIGAKAKVVIACFLVAVVALSFFMIFGAINLKNASQVLDAQEVSIENARNEIAKLEEEINSINGTELQARASQLGYSYSNEANSFSLLALADNTIPVSTNWFDRFCNFVSSIIG